MMKILPATAIVAALVAACGPSGHHNEAQAAPPSATAVDPAPVAPSTEAADIVDTAVGAGSFNTLVAAVQAAGLESTLRGDGPFTVFAPTDEAFAALPEGTVESLLKPENKDQLVAILTYHVLAGEVPSSAIPADGVQAETVQGAKITVAPKDGKVMVNGATVVAADVKASNGVIHVIDKVILPPAA